MHTFQQKQAESETVTPLIGAAVSATLAADAPHEKAIAALLEVAENEEQKRRVYERVHNIIGGTIFAVFVALACTPFIAHYIPGLRDKTLFRLISFLTVANAVVQFGFRNWWGVKPERLQNTVAALLHHPDEPRSLLPFVDSLHLTQTPEEKSLLYPALTERLWNLPAADALLSLDDTRRAILRNTLSSAYAILPKGRRGVRIPNHFDDITTDLTVAIMKTLAGMGDKKTEKVLQRIIKAEATTPNEAVVRDAAREYLPVLVQKAAENDAVQKQLRLCFEEKIRDPHKVVEEFIETLAPEPAKIALVEFLQNEQRDSPIGAFVVNAVGIVALTFLLVFAVGRDAIVGVTACSLISLAYAVLLLMRYSGGNPRVHKIACELSRASGNDTRLLPLLLHAARCGGDAKQADTIKKALVRLLPLLQPGDAARVPPAQRSYLRSWLTIPRNKKKAGSGSQTLTIVALDALAVIGDTKALPAVEKIARQTRRGTYRETELHEAALRCVEALRARKG